MRTGLMDHKLLRFTLPGAALIMLAIATLWAQQHREADLFMALTLTQGAIYLAAVAQLGRPASKTVFAAIIGIAILLRLIALATPVFLSTDINRYVWDGRVQAAGINPYRYVPNDPALTALRDTHVWPNINRATKAHTIYPPVAQMIFLAAQAGGSTVLTMKIAMLLLEAVGMIALVGTLKQIGLPRERLLVYAWHPLPLWEIAGSGHIDAGMVAFMSLALWAAFTRRSRLAGAALAAATLVKLFPIILAPILWGKESWLRRDIRMPMVFIAVAILAYIPYLGVGAGVLGYLPGYAHEEGLSSGTGIWLVDTLRLVMPLPLPIYLAVGGILLLALIYRGFIAPRDRMPANLRDVAVVFSLLISPHYAWYFVWLVPFLAIAPGSLFLWPTLTAVLLYKLHGSGYVQPWIGAIIYGGLATLYLARFIGNRYRAADAR